MSEVISKYVSCPKCEQKSMTEFICSINTEENPTVKEKIFNESFFRWKCAGCGFTTKLLHPLLYHDIRRKFMVYYIPNVDRSQILDESLEKEFSDLSDIRKRMVPNINTMKEKIALFEDGYDDMAVELAKLAVAEVVAKSAGQNVYGGYCTDINQPDNTITFQFFLGSSRSAYLQTTRYDVYSRSLAIVRRYFSSVNRKKGFLNIDQGWAKEALRRYKSWY